MDHGLVKVLQPFEPTSHAGVLGQARNSPLEYLTEDRTVIMRELGTVNKACRTYVTATANSVIEDRELKHTLCALDAILAEHKILLPRYILPLILEPVTPGSLLACPSCQGPFINLPSVAGKDAKLIKQGRMEKSLEEKMTDFIAHTLVALHFWSKHGGPCTTDRDSSRGPLRSRDVGRHGVAGDTGCK